MKDTRIIDDTRKSAEEELKAPMIGPRHKVSRLPFVMFIVLLALAALVYLFTAGVAGSGALVLLAVLCGLSLQVGAHWEKAVVLRFGHYIGLRGPGCFLLIPFIDTVAYWIDQRVVATPFKAEQTLTKDTVPVDVDAILFWMVWDPEKAALEVENYRAAVAWSAQTALRDIIGQTMLSDLLSGRCTLDLALQEMIDKRTEPWGVAVQSVEIRDIVIPEMLQDAMSREAQAERERRARILLGTAEVEIANFFREAAAAYENNPTALQLRAMNILYEGLKEKSGLVIVPSAVADTLNVGSLLGIIGHEAEKNKTNEKNSTAS